MYSVVVETQSEKCAILGYTATGFLGHNLRMVVAYDVTTDAL